MILFECDWCGRRMAGDDPGRFIVKIESYAAAGPMEFSRDEIERDHSAEIRSLIERLRGADPEEIEDQTYRKFHFDLCRDCHGEYLGEPLAKSAI